MQQRGSFYKAQQWLGVKAHALFIVHKQIHCVQAVFSAQVIVNIPKYLRNNRY